MRRSWVLVLGMAAPAGAQDDPPQDLPAQIEQIQRENQEIKRENQELRQRVDRLEQKAPPTLEEDLHDLGAPGADRAGDSTSDLTSSLELDRAGISQAFGGLYTKPFLSQSGGIALGGYVSWNYRDVENQNHTTQFPRLVPFIYAQVTDHIRFATEIEIEEGHEIAVEFAFLDFTIHDTINFRGGAILDPLGKFNLVHDDPVNELTDRPLVDTTIIPSALREIGAGFFGDLASADSQVGRVAYEIYLVQGFRGLFDDGTVGFNTTSGLSPGKASRDIGSVDPFEDHNNNMAQVGRVEWSPVLGSAIGLSGHHGTYDESDDNTLFIFAVDGALDGKVLSRWVGAGDDGFGAFLGGFEFLGEWAHAGLERNDFARMSGVPGDMEGWYGQVNYRLYPACLRALEEDDWLDAGSHFTFVVRRDEIDLDGFERERWTFGVNFRPNQSETVFKFDYQLNTESGDTVAVANDAFVMSIATYF